MKIFAACAAAALLHAAASIAAEAPADFQKQIVPLLENYCYDCHGEGEKKGGLALDKYQSLDAHLRDTELWYSVWKNVATQLMPPAKDTQPAPAERDKLLRWIETAVFKVDPANPDPGRVTIRRLNREEYRNTILDLLGVKFDADEAFPADDTGYGFDTIGDVLNISPLLMEKYLAAAQKIVGDAIEEAWPRIPTQYVSGDQFRVAPENKKTAKYLPFGTPATASKTQAVQFPGKYKVTAEMRVQGSSEATSHTAKVALSLDGKPLETLDVGWDYRKTIELSADVAGPAAARW